MPPSPSPPARPCHTSAVTCLAFSPLPHRGPPTRGPLLLLASASDDASVVLWTVDPARPSSAEPLRVIEAAAGGAPVTRVAFSPDGRMVAAASWSGPPHVWVVRTGRALPSPRASGGAAPWPWFGERGDKTTTRRREARSADGTVVARVDPVDGRGVLVSSAPARQLGAPHGAIPADGDGEAAKHLAELARHGKYHDCLEALRASPALAAAAASGGDERLAALACLHGPDAVPLSTGGGLAAARRAVLLAKACDGDEELQQEALRLSEAATACVGLLAEGSLIDFSDADGALADQSDRVLDRVFAAIAAAPQARGAAPGLAAGDADGWCAATSPLVGHKAHVNALAFSPASPAVLASGSDDGSVRLWLLGRDGSWCSAHTIPAAAPGAQPVTRVWFSRDGSAVVAASWRGDGLAWSAETGARLGAVAAAAACEGTRSAVSASGFFRAAVDPCQPARVLCAVSKAHARPPPAAALCDESVDASLARGTTLAAVAPLLYASADATEVWLRQAAAVLCARLRLRESRRPAGPDAPRRRRKGLLNALDPAAEALAAALESFPPLSPAGLVLPAHAAVQAYLSASAAFDGLDARVRSLAGAVPDEVDQQPLAAACAEREAAREARRVAAAALLTPERGAAREAAAGALRRFVLVAEGAGRMRAAPDDPGAAAATAGVAAALEAIRDLRQLPLEELLMQASDVEANAVLPAVVARSAGRTHPGGPAGAARLDRCREAVAAEAAGPAPRDLAPPPLVEEALAAAAAWALARHAELELEAVVAQSAGVAAAVADAPDAAAMKELLGRHAREVKKLRRERDAAATELRHAEEDGEPEEVLSELRADEAAASGALSERRRALLTTATELASACVRHYPEVAHEARAHAAGAGRQTRVPSWQSSLLQLLDTGGLHRPGWGVGMYADRRELGEPGATRHACEVATDAASGRRVVLKRFELSGARAQSNFRRILKEARLLRAVDHPCVAEVECVFWDRATERGYLVMPHYAGGDLVDWCAARAGDARLLNDVVGQRVLLQLARGLEAVHRAGIVHCDVKPRNVLLGADGEVRLADFDVSHDSGERATLAALTATRATGGAAAGTLDYMAPEVLGGAAAAAAADVWSFGLVAYWLHFGGTLPPLDERLAVAKAEAGRAVRVPPHENENLRELLGALLQGDPRRRPSMEAVLLHPYFLYSLACSEEELLQRSRANEAARKELAAGRAALARDEQETALREAQVAHERLALADERRATEEQARANEARANEARARAREAAAMRLRNEAEGRELAARASALAAEQARVANGSRATESLRRQLAARQAAIAAERAALASKEQAVQRAAAEAAREQREVAALGRANEARRRETERRAEAARAHERRAAALRQQNEAKAARLAAAERDLVAERGQLGELAALASPPRHWAGRLVAGASAARRRRADAATARLVEQLMQSSSRPDQNGVGRDSHDQRFRRFNVDSVQMVENSSVWRAFAHRKREIELSRRGTAVAPARVKSYARELYSLLGVGGGSGPLNEVLLFHATPSAEVANIVVDQGMDERLAGVNAGTAYGAGCYFADSPSKSDQYVRDADARGCFTMLVCRVVLGSCGPCKDGHARRPPCVERQCRAGDRCPHPRHDSLRANPGRFDEFVVFDRTQVYVEMVVRYRRGQ